MPTLAELSAFLIKEFPQTQCTIEAVGDKGATIRHPVGAGELRPGGTVSGPVMMAVADVALYVAILGEIGIVPLAVTTSLSINFLRKPAGDRAVIGDPLSGHVFLFANAQRNRLKLLFWDGSGLWVCAKRLERGRFRWPRAADTQTKVALSHEELALLLGGIDLADTTRRPWYRKAAQEIQISA